MTMKTAIITISVIAIVYAQGSETAVVPEDLVLNEVVAPLEEIQADIGPRPPCQIRPCKLQCSPTTTMMDDGKTGKRLAYMGCAPAKACTRANAGCAAKLKAGVKGAIALAALLKQRMKMGKAPRKALAGMSRGEKANYARGSVASQALVDGADAMAATAKSRKLEAQLTVEAKNKILTKAFEAFRTTKLNHLNAQAAYKGRNSAEKKEYNKYKAKTCDPLNPFTNSCVDFKYRARACAIALCKPDVKACAAKNAACRDQLRTFMKQAADAGGSLKMAAMRRGVGDHAAAVAASNAAKAEMAAAKKAIYAAGALFKEALAGAISAKAASASSQKLSEDADSILKQREEQNNALEKNHLKVQAEYQKYKKTE